MKLAVIAVGRAKNAPEDDLAKGYLERAGALGPKLGFAKLALIVVETSAAASVALRKAEEAKRILAKSPKGASIVVLDEGGKSFSSEDFAKDLARRRDMNAGDLAFVIGGPDGLDPELLKNPRLAFGAQTWPHLLVRVLLSEQIYSAFAILARHPYHRGRG